MNALRLIALISIFFFASFSTHGQESAPLITHTFENQPLPEALSFLDREYDLNFAYDARALSEVFVERTFVNASAEDVLSELLKPSEYGWKLLNGTFVIYRLPQEVAQHEAGAQRLDFTFSANVIDQDSGESLPFATISTRDGKVYAANSEGQVTVENFPSDTSLIYVSYIGYESLEVKLSPDFVAENRDILLSQGRAILPIAAVYGEATRMTKIEKWTGRNTLNVNALRQLPQVGGFDPVRAIQLFPGVGGSTESSAEFHVRGGGSDENLVIYDDFTLYHLDHFYGIFSAFNGNSIKNMRLHKGWFPARFGGRASSLVQITGKEGDREVTRMTADLNFFGANVMLETPLVAEQVTFVLAGRRSYTDFLFSPAYRDLFSDLYNRSITQPGGVVVDPFDGSQNPNFHFYDVTSKLSFRPRKGELVQLSFYSGRDDLDLTYPVVYPEQYNVLYTDLSQWGNNGGSARWNRKWNNVVKTSLVASHSHYQSRLNAVDRIESLQFNETDSIFSNQHMSLRESALAFDLEHHTQGHAMVLGAKVNANAITFTEENSEGLDITRTENAVTTTVFGQDEFELNERLQTHIGARFSHYSGTGNVYVEPRVGLHYKLAPKAHAKASFGQFVQTIRRIRPQNLFLNSPDIWRLSNPDVVPVLKVNHWAAGLQVEGDKWLLDIEGYYKTSTGAIVDPAQYQLATDSAFSSFWVGTGEVYGVDILLQKTVGKHTGWISSSIGKASHKFDHIEYEIPAPEFHTGEFKAVYAYKLPRWKISGTFIYGTGKPFTPILGTYELEHINGTVQTLPAVGTLNSAWLEEYHRLDISVSYAFQLAHSNARLGVSVLNVYDHQNISQRQYFITSSGGGSAIDFREVAMMGFLPTLQFSITY